MNENQITKEIAAEIERRVGPKMREIGDRTRETRSMIRDLMKEAVNGEIHKNQD